MTTHTHCPDQQAGEAMPEYATRVLRYALRFGPEPLSLSQLETADAAAVRLVAGLPQEVDAYAYTSLDADATRLYDHLRTLRAQMAAQMAARRAQLAGLQRLIDQATMEAETAANAPAADQTPQSEQDRAIMLLRVALTLIMQPGAGSGNGGGRLAPLRPPQPVRPGPQGGLHADEPPTLPPAGKDGIAF
jgi:hypothetical protein